MNNAIIIQYKLYNALSYVLRLQTEEESPTGRHSQLRGDWEAVGPKHDPVKARSMLEKHGLLRVRSGLLGRKRCWWDWIVG